MAGPFEVRTKPKTRAELDLEAKGKGGQEFAFPVIESPKPKAKGKNALQAQSEAVRERSQTAAPEKLKDVTSPSARLDNEFRQQKPQGASEKYHLEDGQELGAINSEELFALRKGTHTPNDVLSAREYEGSIDGQMAREADAYGDFSSPKPTPTRTIGPGVAKVGTQPGLVKPGKTQGPFISPEQRGVADNLAELEAAGKRKPVREEADPDMQGGPFEPSRMEVAHDEIERRQLDREAGDAYSRMDAENEAAQIREHNDAFLAGRTGPIEGPISPPRNPAEVKAVQDAALDRAKSRELFGATEAEAKAQPDFHSDIARDISAKESAAVKPIEAPKPKAKSARTEAERKADVEGNKRVQEKIGEYGGKLALSGGLLGAAALTANFLGGSDNKSPAAIRSGGSGASGPNQVQAGISKTPEQLAAEAAEMERNAKLKADNTPDARLPGGGAAFMRNEGPFELSGGQKGKYAENVLVGKGGQSMPETGQQLINRLRAESGQTVAVRSKREADDRAAGNAVADAAIKARGEKNAKLAEVKTAQDLDNARAKSFVDGRVAAAGGLNTQRGDAIRERARAGAMDEYGQVRQQEAVARSLAEETKAKRDVGMAQAAATAGKAQLAEDHAQVEKAKVMIAQQKQGLAEFLKMKQDNAASYGPRLTEIANAFSNHFFTSNAPEQTALNFDNKAPSPGEIEAGLSRAFQDSQDPDTEQNYSHALQLAGLPDTMEHRALLAIRLARAGKDINKPSGQQFIENHFK